MTDQVNEAATNLYHAVHAMLLVVGRDGEIDSRHESTSAVMQALRAIDGGQYNPELQIQATHPSRGEIMNELFGDSEQLAHPSRGVVDEVAERRALNKALDALDALSERWASEIGLDAMCANLAKAEDVPAAIRAMAVQAWVEGAYAGRTSHQAAALPAVPEGESVTLTVAQIADLAAFAGLTLAAVPELSEDERAAEITVCTCPDKGVLLDGEDSDPGVIAHYAHIAYYSEYPGEGCIGLGPEIAATPKDQPAQGVG